VDSTLPTSTAANESRLAQSPASAINQIEPAEMPVELTAKPSADTPAETDVPSDPPAFDVHDVALLLDGLQQEFSDLEYNGEIGPILEQLDRIFQEYSPLVSAIHGLSPGPRFLRTSTQHREAMDSVIEDKPHQNFTWGHSAWWWWRKATKSSHAWPSLVQMFIGATMQAGYQWGTFTMTH
jgi:hypothetical protein